MMETLKQRFPPGLDYLVALDTTLAVSEGIEEIIHTLFEALVLVILVVFLFLQGWRATLIPLLAVPVSLIGTFAFFPLLDFSINTLSLFGLVLAIGLVVDDPIVVVESVEHHIERGLNPREATLQTMREVTGPIFATSLALIAVFFAHRVPYRHHRPPVSAVRGDRRGRRHLHLQRLDAKSALSALLLRPKVRGRAFAKIL